MLICSKSKQRALIDCNEKLVIKVKGENLMIVEKIKYLGVKIDQNLELKEHFKYVSSKVARAIGFLKCTKNFIPRNRLNKLYRSIVELYFRYCCSVWGCCSSTPGGLLATFLYGGVRVNIWGLRYCNKIIFGVCKLQLWKNSIFGA